MKFAVFALLAFIAAVYAAPTSIQDNNIGDIVTVGINLKANITNKIDQDIVNVIVALLNQQGIVIAPGSNAAPAQTPSQVNDIISKLLH
jgi:hypothetical protein